jgi:hypothetical protein
MCDTHVYTEVRITRKSSGASLLANFFLLREIVHFTNSSKHTYVPAPLSEMQRPGCANRRTLPVSISDNNVIIAQTMFIADYSYLCDNNAQHGITVTGLSTRIRILS